MKNKTLYSMAICALLSLNVFGQENSIKGNVHIPSFQTLKVVLANTAPLDFATAQDYINGITVKNYCTLQMIANDGWKIEAFLEGSASKTLPPGVLSVQVEGYTDFIPLTKDNIQILQSFNRKIVNTLQINLRVNPGFKLDEATLLMINFVSTPL